MDDLIDGTIDGRPVSIPIESAWAGAKATGAHCCPYGQDEVGDSPDEIWAACDRITEACEGLTASRSLRKAKSLRFVAD